MSYMSMLGLDYSKPYSEYDAAYGGVPSGSSGQTVVLEKPAEQLTKGQKYAGAGIQVGGNLLSAYLQAKMQEEQNKRKQLVDAAQGEQAMTTNAMRSLGSSFSSSLR